MSRQLISRSADLSRLQADGYEIDVVASLLVVGHVPYLNGQGELRYGRLICPLVLQNDQTGLPSDHTMMFDGEKPYAANGSELQIVASTMHQDHAVGVSSEFIFSRKPKRPGDQYVDYYEKTTTYVEFLGRHARQVDSTATARTYLHVLADDEGKSVFRYGDNASARANIQLATDKLKQAGPVAIVGLGGTGTYILDLVAKTPVNEIHLFDGDRFSQHNAFRSPGAPSGSDLDGAPPKVAYFGAIYDRMHAGVHQHSYFINEDNVHELALMKFVFVAVDDGRARRLITAALEAADVPFIDVGMGIYEYEAVLGGQLRTTTSTSASRELVRRRLPTRDPDAANQYRANIQIADLNALNATLAVIKWKKLCGFYEDTDHEHHSVYVIGGNRMIAEEFRDEAS